MRLRFRIRPPVTDKAAAVERTVEVDGARGSLTVGRESGADIELPFTTVSSKHARLVYALGVWAVSDLGSANGTFFKGQRLRLGVPQVIEEGQIFQLADVDVVFEGAVVGAGGSSAAESTATLARRLVNDLFGALPAEVARLRVEEGPEQGKELVLAQPGHGYRVGRAPGCDLVLLDDDVSREHASFVRSWDGVEVRDLGSKNGVEIEGERIAEMARLHDGDAVLVGSTRLRLEDPEDRYLRKMQEKAVRPTTLVLSSVPDRSPPPAPVAPPPRSGTTGTLAIAAVALAVLVAASGLLLWFLLGSG